MAEWVDIPAHRVLLVTSEEFHEQFDRLGEDGQRVQEGMVVYMVRRIKDGKLFRVSPWQPGDSFDRFALVEF